MKRRRDTVAVDVRWQRWLELLERAHHRMLQDLTDAR